ncbi:MAG: hypothetical protein ACRDYB_13760 [Acidimicrobiales bacterium]
MAIGLQGDPSGDSLAGGVFMATGGRMGPMLLVGGTPLASSIDTYLGTLPPSAHRYVFGGPLALRDDVLIALQAAVG